LFGILVIAFSSYQAVVVPNQNAEVEFNHFQDVQDDFTEFRSTLINSVGATDDRSVTFRLGTQYPARLIALNPPPVSGQLQTTQEQDVTIDGEILDDNIDSICGIENPTTRSLTYTPNYNEFRSPQAITYENTFVVREFSDGTVYGEQQLFEKNESGNDQINLLLLNESVSLSGQGTRSFEITPSNQRTVEVSNPTITIPSEFDEDEWRNEILADVPDEALDGENAITGTGDGPFEITIRFDGDYDVSCQGTEVEQEGEETGDGTGSLFDTQWDESSPVTVQPDSNIDLTAEVLERGTNRRIDDARVDFAIEEGIQDETAELINADLRTNDGEATVTLDTKEGSGGSEFEVYVTVGDDSDVLTVDIEEEENGGQNPVVEQLDADQRGSSAKIDVDWVVSDEDGDLDEVEIVLREDDADGTVIETTIITVEGGFTDGETAFEEDDGVERDQEYYIELTVTDEAGNTASSSTTVTVEQPGRGPPG